MCQSLKNAVKKYVELKEQIAALEAEVKKTSEKVMSGLAKEGLKSFEYNGNKVTMISSTRSSYSDSIISMLKEKAPVCIKETYDNDKLKACITSGIIKEEDIAPYVSSSVSTYIKLTKAK